MQELHFEQWIILGFLGCLLKVEVNSFLLGNSIDLVELLLVNVVCLNNFQLVFILVFRDYAWQGRLRFGRN